MAVCASHLRNVALVDYNDLDKPTFFDKFFYGVTSLGHESVIIFFVLSGFFVGGSVLKSSENFSIVDYAIARLTRLWIVLVPALTLTFIIDSIIAMYFPEALAGSYFNIWHSAPKSSQDYSSSMATLLGNIFFLQTILVPVFGTNGPLWSLANEFWYYLIFPISAFALGNLKSSVSTVYRFLAYIAVIMALFWLPAGFFSGFVVWLAGVMVWYFSNKIEKKRRFISLILSAMFFILSIAYGKSNVLQTKTGISGDYVLGLGFAIFCLILATWPQPTRSIFGAAVYQISTRLSEFSYSLYLTHFSFVVIIGVFVYGTSKSAPTLKNIFVLLGWFSCLLLIGYVFWLVFERQTVKFRTYIVHLILK